MIADFYADLKALPLVATFTGGRVFPMVSKKDFGNQFITFTPISIVEDLLFGGKDTTRQTIQVDIYSNSLMDNHSVADVIRERYNGFTGVLNSNTSIALSKVEAQRDSIDTVDSSIYRHSMDITFTF